MINHIKKLFDPSRRILKQMEPIVAKIDALEPEFERKSIEELREGIAKIRESLKPYIDGIPDKYKTSLKSSQKKDADYVVKEEKLKEKLLSYLPEVYATVREITKRKVGISHFPVQLLTSTILAQGYKLTEVKTGEGKTLVFQLPAALYGLTGRGSHVITVNDYLARLHGEYAGHILSEIGITVGIITPQQSYKFVANSDVKNYKGEEIGKKAEEQHIVNPGDCDGVNLIDCSKKDAYACDVVYGTNNEFGFDYLRDNMTTSIDNIAQKELYFCIVDEADSILIDEARTPLIISSPAAQSNDLYQQFAKLIPRLNKETDFTIDEKAHSVVLTDEGAEKMEKLLGVKNIWQDYRMAHHLENALKAEHLYKNNEEYIVKDGQVLIVDDFTGRVLEGRRYSEGLHQAIEAKEGVEINRESKTLGTITFQNFFRLYKILSGGSGTVMTETEEFYKIYNLESVEVPTNKPVIRVDHTDKVYKNRSAKFNAVAEEVKDLNKKGQPALIGTATIDDSEAVSRLLESKGIEHAVLNAKFHEKEAKIVANAGKKGSVTVATNMAGRGTDIKLGGKDATKEEFEEVVKLGGLAIIGTQRHESRRIDNQLRGRAGRQGEPGFSRFYVALDDEIMRIQGGEMVQRIMEMTNIPDDMPIEAGIIGRSIESSQKRMEGMHFDSRKTVVEYDDVVNQQREIFYSRRRRILEEIDNAINEMKEENKGQESLSKLQQTLFDQLELEIKYIVNAHFLEARSDSIDRVKVVDDYFDIANDELLNQALEKSNYPVDSTKSFRERFVQILKDKKQEEIEETLSKITKIAFDLKMAEFGNDLPNISKVLVLRTMDDLWTDQLDAMKDLRDGIGLRGFAQQDPLVEYKNEGFNLFDKFIVKIDSQVARRLLKIQKVITKAPIIQEQVQTNEEEVKDVSTGSREIATAISSFMHNQSDNQRIGKTQPQKTVTNERKNINRNDPCPCGSGLKYKKCGLINSPSHRN